MFYLALLFANSPQESKPQVEITKDTSKQTKKEILDKLRLGVVMINVRSPFSGEKIGWFGDDASWQGTGFIVDKEKGIIATNRHVAGENSVATYEVKFSDGSEIEAKFLYEDPFIDIAFLQIDPKLLPQDSVVLEFSDDFAKINEEIYSVGNAWGENFSVGKGTVISPFENTGPFSDQSFKYSGLSVGGISGSPIVDENVKVKGIIYGGRFISGLFLPIVYVKNALKSLKEGAEPIRKSTGVIFKYESLRKCTESGIITKNANEEYKKLFPDAHDKLIVVKMVYQNSPAAKKLFPGDVIWSLNGKVLGPWLYTLDDATNTNETIKIGVYREGTLKEIELKCKKLPRPKREILTFGGGTFVEKGIDGKFLMNIFDDSVFLTKAQTSSDFNNLTHGRWGSPSIVEIKKIDEFDIKDLNSFKAIIPKLKNRKLLKVYVLRHTLVQDFSDKMIRNTDRDLVFVQYNGEFDSPKYFHFDYDQKKWIGEDLK